MSTVTVSDLFIYPVKSTFRLPVPESEVLEKGLLYDRTLAIANEAGEILTARENQRLYQLETKLDDHQLIFQTEEHDAVAYPLRTTGRQQTANLFHRPVPVEKIDHTVNLWLSEVLNEPVHLVRISQDTPRAMKSKHNGRADDFIRLQDAAAIHLITTSSLAALNNELEEAVSPHHFRPNIVVSGSIAYAEDGWKSVQIGACAFDVAVKTARCSMTTIHPDTQTIHQRGEPLRTLAQLRLEDGKINFGIYLIPRKIGRIHIGDEVRVGL